MVRPLRFQGSIPGRHGQLGVAAVYGAFSLIAGISAMALAIDVGRLYYAQRDLEKLAASAALDAARSLSGCYTSVGAPGSASAVATAVTASITNALTNRLGGDVLTPADVMQPFDSNVKTIEFGTFKSQVMINGLPSRAFVVSTAGANGVDAVQVNLARTQPTPLIPFLFSTSPTASVGLLRASAAAQQTPTVSFALSSTLANINPQVLAPLLGISVTAVSNAGIANIGANVTTTLANIGAAVGVANPDDLLNTVLTLPQALGALSNALNPTLAGVGDAAQSATATALAALAAAADPSRTTTLGAVLGVAQGAGQQVAGLSLNVAELTKALAVSASHGLYPLEIPVSAGVAGVSLRAFLTLGPSASNTATAKTMGATQGEGPAGFDSNGDPRTFAHVQQLGLAIRLGVGVEQIPALGALISSNFLLHSLLGQPVNLGIDVSGASADAFLSGVQCPAPVSGTRQSPNKPVVTIVASTNAATVKIGTFKTATPMNPVITGPLISVPPLLAINVDPLAVLPLPGSPSQAYTIGPFDTTFPSTTPNNTADVGAVDADLASALSSLSGTLASNLNVSLLNGLITVPAGQVAGGLLSVINPIIAGPVTALLNSLGVSVAGAQITVLSMEYGTQAGANSKTLATNTPSAPVLFSLDRPVYDIPIQTPSNTSTR